MIKLRGAEYAEGMTLEIHEDYIVYPRSSVLKRDPPCRHASIKKDDVVIPWIIKAFNEGGYNHTLVCLDCVLEALKKEAK